MPKPIWSNIDTNINLQIPTKRKPTEEERREQEIAIARLKVSMEKWITAGLLAADKKMREQREQEQRSQPPQPPTD